MSVIRTVKHLASLALVIMVLALLMAMFASSSTGSGSSSTGATLNISAGRGGGGFEITNRERGPVDGCRVTILDQGDDEWSADVSDKIAPYETIRIGWDRFTSHGQPMPAYVGMNRKYATIACDTTDGYRSAGVAF